MFDGDFHGKLMASLCSIDTPSPIFSTGNKLSLRSWSEWHSSYEYYDITYTTTNAGKNVDECISILVILCKYCYFKNLNEKDKCLCLCF